MNRRTFVGAAIWGTSQLALRASTIPMPKLCVFTKHLQFLTSPEALAEAIAEIGVEGADLALRKGGNIEPERAQEDLPAMVRALAKNRLELSMVTTDVVDTESPMAETVLRAIAGAGVKYYRWGGFKFDAKVPAEKQIEALKPRVAKLAALNRKLGLCAIYHTHSGLNQFGAAIWDLHLLLREFDPKEVAVNYDIGHATVEGGYGGWIESLNVTGRHLGGVALKDFVWKKSGANWRPQWCPVGEGMVRFSEFFAMIQRMQFAGPVQVHYEYPLGGAESGKREITIPRQQVIDAMKADVKKLRECWAKSGS